MGFIDIDVQILGILHEHVSKRDSDDRETRLETTFPGYKRDLTTRIDSLLDQRLELMGVPA